MAIRWECIGCGSLIQVPEDVTVRKARCPSCRLIQPILGLDQASSGPHSPESDPAPGSDRVTTVWTPPPPSGESPPSGAAPDEPRESDVQETESTYRPDTRDEEATSGDPAPYVTSQVVDGEPADSTDDAKTGAGQTDASEPHAHDPFTFSAQPKDSPVDADSIPDHTALAIATLVIGILGGCFCVPTGVLFGALAIIFARLAARDLDRGQLDSAGTFSRLALAMCILGIVLTIIPGCIGLLMMGAAVIFD